MGQKEQPDTRYIPILDLSDGAEMLSEFNAEALNYLASAENALFKLDTVPGDHESLDTIFKVFHVIQGLAAFLNLTDIQRLAHAGEDLLQAVRKQQLAYNEPVSVATLHAVSGVRTLLSLLNEQITNDGKLRSPYFNIEEVVAEIHDIIQQRGSPDGRNGSAPGTASSGSHKSVNDYASITEKIKIACACTPVDTVAINGALEDLKKMGSQSAATQEKLLQRQQELIQERELALRLSDQARDTARAKSDFLSSVAHEIRTLINAILGFSSLLSKDPLNKQQKTRLATITASAQLVLDVVNNILDFSKIEHGKLALEEITFDVRRIAEEAADIARGRIAGKPIKVSCRVASDIPQKLIGDPAKLKHIFINLLDNAVKFTKSGSVTIDIRRKLTQDTPAHVTLLCAVADTGIGIPKDRREHIFEVYSQADTSITRRYGGTGLGLSICKSYAEAMGGAIEVDSQIGKGSTFTLTVTLKEATDADDKKASRGAPTQRKKSSRTKPADRTLEGIAVLVAEDSIPNQELIKAYFEIIGCDGDYAANGKEAIEKAKSGTYDLCLMDLQMPDIGGIEATQKIHHECHIDMPIVALTGATVEEERAHCLESGMVGYLAKPFDIHQLRAVIETHAKVRKAKKRSAKKYTVL